MRLRVFVPLLLAVPLVAGLAMRASTPPRPDAASADGPHVAADGLPGSDGRPRGDGQPDPGGAPPPFKVDKLAAGARPPQFVVVSFDGVADHELLQHYLALARKTGSRFSMNLSGVLLIPKDKRESYLPPKHRPGASDIGFADRALVPQRIVDISTAYREGHEIATHFNGHFCGPRGVNRWSTADWVSEIKQFNDFVDNWKQHFGPSEVGGFPFRSDIIVGGRTPCLEGDRDAMYPAFKRFGYRYDSSNVGLLKWPQKKAGMWDFPLQMVKVAGFGRRTLSMDYNFMCVQNNCSKHASPAASRRYEESTLRSLVAAADAVYEGSRAPFFVGNHLNDWAGGAYHRALTRFIETVCGSPKYPDVRCVSNADLADWLDAQDPAVVTNLQSKPEQAY